MVLCARSATIAAALFAAIGGEVYAQGDAGEQTYLKVTLENVQITSYRLGALDNNVGRALDAAGVKYTAADVSAASREAAAKLKTRLGGRTGTAKIVVCVPPGSKTCIEIVCQQCGAE
jgi:hypothetical protein